MVTAIDRHTRSKKFDSLKKCQGQKNSLFSVQGRKLESIFSPSFLIQFSLEIYCINRSTAISPSSSESRHLLCPSLFIGSLPISIEPKKSYESERQRKQAEQQITHESNKLSSLPSDNVGNFESFSLLFRFRAEGTKKLLCLFLSAERKKGGERK